MEAGQVAAVGMHSQLSIYGIASIMDPSSVCAPLEPALAVAFITWNHSSY